MKITDQPIVAFLGGILGAFIMGGVALLFLFDQIDKRIEITLNLPEIKKEFKGDRGETGEKGEMGDKGDPGSKGDKGDKGDDGKDASAPVGTIVSSWKEVPPSGWLLCDGEPIPNGSQYAEIKSLLGQRTPDLRGVFLRGWDPTGTVDKDRAVENLGIGSQQDDSFQIHQHFVENIHGKTGKRDYLLQGGSLKNNPDPKRFAYEVAYQNEGKPATWRAGGIAAQTDSDGSPRFGHETRPKNVAVNFIIKY